MEVYTIAFNVRTNHRGPEAVVVIHGGGTTGFNSSSCAFSSDARQVNLLVWGCTVDSYLLRTDMRSLSVSFPRPLCRHLPHSSLDDPMVSNNIHLPCFDDGIVAPATHPVESGIERQTVCPWRPAAEAAHEPEAVDEGATDHTRLVGMRRRRARRGRRARAAAGV